MGSKRPSVVFVRFSPSAHAEKKLKRNSFRTVKKRKNAQNPTETFATQAMDRVKERIKGRICSFPVSDFNEGIFNCTF